jgi:hypothetical protein
MAARLAKFECHADALENQIQSKATSIAVNRSDARSLIRAFPGPSADS